MCLMEELLTNPLILCKHSYANFAIQGIFKYGVKEHKRRLIDVLTSDVQRVARHRIASHVLRCALTHCLPEELEGLISAIKGPPKSLTDLAHHPTASFVVRDMRQ